MLALCPELKSCHWFGAFMDNSRFVVSGKIGRGYGLNNIHVHFQSFISFSLDPEGPLLLNTQITELIEFPKKSPLPPPQLVLLTN